MTVLQMRDVQRSFHQGHKTIDVLRGINLDVEAGELVALIGSSGSGKSTLLQVAGLLDSAYSGQLTVAGFDAEGMKDEQCTKLRREKLGFVYQSHHLLPEFSAEENVALALKVAGESDSSARAAAREILADLGLEDRLDHTPAKLSGGEQQRVAIARAIVGKPQLLLADEPTGNLDESTAKRVLDLLLKTVRNRGLAAVIATHDRGLAARLDRQLHLSDGSLVAL